MSSQNPEEKPITALTHFASRRGKELIGYEGFMYYLNNQSGTTRYYSCSEKKRGCKARINCYKSRDTFVQNGVHVDHLPNHDLIRARVELTYAKTLAKEHPDLPVNQVINQLQLEQVFQDPLSAKNLKRRLVGVRKRALLAKQKAIHRAIKSVVPKEKVNLGAGGRALKTESYNPVFNIGEESGDKRSLKEVENALKNWLRPAEFAEPEDNLGLIVGSGKYTKDRKTIKKILVCVDIKPVVVEEAISKEVDLIISYRPPINNGIRTVAHNSWREQLIARCIAYDIAVFSTHSALANIPGGINDKILEAFNKDRNAVNKTGSIFPAAKATTDVTGIQYNLTVSNAIMLYDKIPFENDPSITANVGVDDENMITLNIYSRNGLDEIKSIARDLGLQSCENGRAPPFMNAGIGRVLDLQVVIDLGAAIDAIKNHLHLEYVQTAFGGNELVKRIAVHVGSSKSIANNIPDETDLIISGEMSHQDTLDCIYSNASVVLCNRCSSERHFLPVFATLTKVVTGVTDVFVSDEDANPLHLIV